MNIFNVSNIIGYDTIDSLMDSDFANTKNVKFTLSDNTTVDMNSKQFILHCILWQPYLTFDLSITKNDIFSIDKITSETISDIHTVIYDRLLKEALNIDLNKYINKTDYSDLLYWYVGTDNRNIVLLTSLWENINYIYKFTKSYIKQYSPSMSILSLARLRADKRINKIINTKLDPRDGSKVAEKKLNYLTNEFVKLTSTPGEIKNNVLLPFMQTGTLKKNQIPQMMISYGPRSDIEDTMMTHIINDSAMSGLKTVSDFACESLSTKKSSFYSKTVIKDSSYFNRMMRLACISTSKIYEGSCGSETVIPFTIKSEFKHNFMDKNIIVDNKLIRLNPSNIDNYVDKEIKMITALSCIFKDGVCERCMGRGDMDFKKWNPPGIHIGLYSSSIIGDIIKQMVLSTKHLIKTNSLEYVLPPIAAKYLRKRKLHLYLTIPQNKLHNITLRVPDYTMSNITDLKHDKLLANRFSRLSWFEILKNDKSVDNVELFQGEKFKIHFTQEFISFMRKNINNINHRDTFIDIPLNGFDTKQPIIKHIAHTDDMIRFNTKVKTFLTTQVSSYTNLTECLQDFSEILFNKISINIVFVEILLKSFVTRFNGNANDVVFSKLNDIINNHSVSTKLGFERLNFYFKDPKTSIVPKQKGLFDLLLGFQE